MRVALVHDWLTGIRAGEGVLEQLIQLPPRRMNLPTSAGTPSELPEIRLARKPRAACEAVLS